MAMLTKIIGNLFSWSPGSRTIHDPLIEVMDVDPRWLAFWQSNLVTQDLYDPGM